MPLSEAQKNAAQEVIDVVTSTAASGRGKRLLADMFLELPDRDSWSEYYEVIPEPRCINLIKSKLEKNGYRSVLDVFSDLSLVFANALYYNEEGSQIAKDAQTLKDILEAEWPKHSVLPTPRASPPPSSLQKKSAQSATPTSPSRTQTQPPATKPSPPTKHPKTATVAVATAPQSIVPAPIPQTGGMASDMEVDVGGGPSENEAEGYGEAMADEIPTYTTRDPESDEIVRQLERGIPRWGGFGEKGWVDEIDLDRCTEIVQVIKSHKDIVSNSRVASALDAIPDDATIKNLSFNHPLSLKIIESKARAKQYSSSKELDLDMARLFEKGRRWYDIGSEQYGNVLLLQRLYQALTSSTPPTGPPYTSQTHFAALRAGPGTARPMHASGAETDGLPGVTTFRVSNKDRTFVDELHYKGWSVRLADWLHLANPDDPSRPIVGQVFKCYVSEELSKKGRPGVTVCWYYRPEQTFHPADKEFYENEVFKTGHFADHPLEDIVEKIACQFTARHVRGRPRPPYWHPGWPLYVCDARYNDRERLFVRIKNWNSCVPEDVRKSTEFMPIYPFERTVFPRRVPSPFVAGGAGVKGRGGRNGNVRFPGGIGEAVERAEGEKIEGGGTGRKRVRKPGVTGGGNTPVAGPSRQNNGAASGAPPGFPFPGYGTQAQMPAPRRTEDRSIVTAAGGMTTLASNALVEKLPSETAKHFDRDPDTNEVLWFSGPPIDVARPVPPRYSLDYLHHLAMKRKKAMQGTDDGEGPNGTDGEAKRPRTKAPPTMTETLNELWEACFIENGTA